MGKYEKLVRAGIMDLTPYLPGKPIEEVQRELGLDRVIKLASNETAVGPSPLAVAAINKEADSVNFYPEGQSTPLREKLAAKLGIDKDMLIISNGGDDIIRLVSLAFVNAGDEVIMADITFPVYEGNIRIMGGKVVPVALKNHTHDLDAMAASINARTKMIYICNPNNPTGTINTKAEIDAFMQKVPADVIVIMDEAYCDYVDDPAYPNSIDYLASGKPVIGIRTFSKIAGIAGVRIGYAMAQPELIGYMGRVMEAFPANRLAQAAAMASMDDDAHRQRVLELNREGKIFYHRAFDEMGLAYSDSKANFVFVDLKRDSAAVYDKMMAKGVIIRPGKTWGCPDWTRITIGTPEENAKCVQALKEVLDLV